MKTTVRTSPRIGDMPRRRKKKSPAAETLLRIEWINWLVEKYGAEAVSEWQEAPITFAEWCRERSLTAHEAA